MCRSSCSYCIAIELGRNFSKKYDSRLLFVCLDVQRPDFFTRWMQKNSANILQYHFYGALNELAGMRHESNRQIESEYEETHETIVVAQKQHQLPSNHREKTIQRIKTEFRIALSQEIDTCNVHKEKSNPILSTPFLFVIIGGRGLLLASSKTENDSSNSERKIKSLHEILYKAKIITHISQESVPKTTTSKILHVQRNLERYQQQQRQRR